MKVAMIGHKDFPSRSGGVEVMVGGLATSLVRRGYEVTVYNRGLQKGHNVYTTEGVQARRIFTFQKASLNAMVDRKSTRLNSSHPTTSRMPSSA